jgi:glutaredoxin
MFFIRTSTLVGLFLISLPVLAAGVYRYTDANGSVVFTDQPPPGKKAELKQFRGAAQSATGSTRKQVVVWLTADCGAPCDNARALLRQRDVAYQTRNPVANAADAEALKRLTGDLTVPVLQIIGGGMRKGYDSASWGRMLDDAGYVQPGQTATGTTDAVPHVMGGN